MPEIQYREMGKYDRHTRKFNPRALLFREDIEGLSERQLTGVAQGLNMPKESRFVGYAVAY